MDQIAKYRTEIDEIDDQIMELLNKRYDLSIKIGIEKKQVKTHVFDQNREQYIINKASKYSHSPQIEEVYKTIMNESKTLQRK